MKRGQCFVRAKSPSGKWGSHDVLDLTEESFRVFTLDRLAKAGMVVIIKPEYVKGEELVYISKVEKAGDE